MKNVSSKVLNLVGFHLQRVGQGCLCLRAIRDYSTFEHYFYIAGFSFSKIQTDRYSLDRVGFFRQSSKVAER